MKTARDCQKECQLNPRCKEFNFQEVEPFKCLLKYGKMAKWKYENGNCDACKDWTYGPKSCNQGKLASSFIVAKLEDYEFQICQLRENSFHSLITLRNVAGEACKDAYKNNQLQDITSMEVMTSNGWIFENLTKDMALCMPFKSDVSDFCGGSLGWYGWGCGSKKGSISTILRGSGTAQLYFGNCWNTGKVNVWLNGNKVLSSNSDTMKLSLFDYRNGDKLEITDEDTGIIQIRNITFKCKGNYCFTIL